MNPSDADRADAYLHGLMPDWEVAEFERRLVQDADLRTVLDVARRRLAVLEAALPPAEADERLVQATLRRVEGYERRRAKWRKRLWYGLLAPLAAVIAVVGLFHVHYNNLSATPANLEVFGQERLAPASAGALRVRLTDGRTRAPMAGVPVDVTLGEPGGAFFETLATFTTDARGNGQPSFRLPDWVDGRYTLRVTARTAARPEVLSRLVNLTRSSKLMLTTDKPVYQPGQTIHVRSLTLRKPDLKPAADAPAVITVTDPKGNVIFRHEGRTSRFGIAAADCPLADELIEGAYTVRASAGADTHSTVTVEVFKYVLPKIKLTVTTERPWYSPGEEVRGRIDAVYFHGEPVADAVWTLEARSPETGPAEIARSSSRTGPDGRATFAFRLPNQSGSRGTTKVELTVGVRDAAGQQYVRTTSVALAAQPLAFDVVPESGVLVRGVPNTVYVLVTTPDGVPARAKLTANVAGVNQEFSTSELGVGSFEVTPFGADISVQLRAVGEHGTNANRQVSMPVGGAVLDFLLRTDKAVYSGGDSLKLTATGGGYDPVFLDILKDGQTVRSDVIDMAGGEGEVTVDLPPDVFGTLQLCGYRFDAGGRPVRKTRVIYVRPARDLKVEIKPDRPEYRPGDTSKLTFTLTDAAGRPTPGALSLSAVDEAVFAVRRQRPGLEATFYLLEQELLRPVYRMYPWSPDEGAGGDAPRRQFEQALFARTVRLIDAPVQSRDQTYFARGSAKDGPMANSASSVAVDVPSDEPVAMDGVTPPPHSLTESSYTAKALEVAKQRYAGLERVHVAWRVVGFAIGVLVYAAGWVYLRWYYMAIGSGIAVAAGTMVLLLALVSSSRLASSPAGRGADAAMAPGAVVGRGAPRSVDSPMPGGPGMPGMPAVRVRDRFPETMLWRPELITDDAGRVTLDVELADSITTWRVSASAVGADGRLGAAQKDLRVFQPFFIDLNLPVALTRGDEIDVPVVASNYSAADQKVELTLTRGDWFDLTGADVQTVNLKPKEVRAVPFRLRAKKAGRFELTVTARGDGLTDAVKRQVEVVPDGRKVEDVRNGTMAGPATFALTVPQDAIDGSAHAVVRIYPSTFSQLVEGLDGIFRLPTGCFEQTSSSLYPNVMALSYLKQTGKAVPAVEAKARQYIHTGYQRLLTFEVPGGGFDWYGRPPANITLTAYGLMEFRDMAKVHNVDPELIKRTRQWLLSHRQRDGSWVEGRGGDRAMGRSPDPVRTTAYVAWAVFDGPSPDAAPTREFLLKRPAHAIPDPYVLALVAGALLAIDGNADAARPYLDRLDALKQVSPDGRTLSWPLPESAATIFYGSGVYAQVETTALAVLTFLTAKTHPANLRPGLTWLAERRNDGGHWGSTQATVLALKALLAGTGAATGDGRRRIEIALDGRPVETLDVPADQAEVMKQVDLSSKLKPGANELTLRDLGDAGTGYQVAFRYHVPGPPPAPPAEPLAIELKYDRTSLAVGQALTATATVTNRTDRAAPMVMLDLPIPAGFVLDRESLPPAQANGAERFEVTPRQLIVYLRELAPNRPVVLSYRLTAAVPADVTAAAGRAYEYYNPSKEGRGTATRLKVSPPRGPEPERP